MPKGLSWLDVKLGVRMLVKYPLLTLVGGVSITVAVALAAAWFQFGWNMIAPALPFDDAERIVKVENQDVSEAEADPKVIHHFETWRDELTSIDALSAAAPAKYMLRTEDGRSRTVNGARVTASAFRVLGVAPILGRPLVESDFAPGAPTAAVIGYDVWQRLFDGDRGVVGRAIRLGEAAATVVGVMPEGFGFPLNHEVWVPFRERAVDHARGEGPSLLVFGRLAPGSTRDAAQAELTAIGRRAAAEFPASNAQLRPRVGPLFGMGWQARFAGAANLMFVLLLVVICANVAILVFARTARREGELAIRSALGASRRRLLLQLFSEALVLTGLSAAVGLVLADWGLDWGMALFWDVQQMRPPFWWTNDLSPVAILYTMALAVVGALVVGGVPALRATGRSVRPALSSVGTGGGGLKFGRLSTGVIVAQVALCVIFVPLAMVQGQELLENAGVTTTETRFPADEFLSGELSRKADVPPSAMSAPDRQAFLARTAELHDEVRRRLADRPDISAVTFVSQLPGFNHVPQLLELEDRAASADSALRPVRTLGVDLAFFDVMNAPVLAGRGFRPSDVESGIGVAVVGEGFVRDVLGGRSALGQRLRYPQGEGADRWYEIVGVVRDPAMITAGPGEYVAVYHPLRAGEQASVRMFLRASGDPDPLVGPVASAIASVDPTLVVEGFTPLDDLWRPVQESGLFFAGAIAAVVLLALLLALAGIYALMSFTVSQRTREIGIRAALGADPRRILATIFSRALAQIGIGVLVGGLIVGSTLADAAGGVGRIAGVGALMLAVGLLACLLPARRALRIQPTDALKAEG